MGVTNLAVMSFDGVNLLLPQHEVGTIEVANSILAEGEVPGAVGLLRSGGIEWPVFALTSEFNKQSIRPQEYKFCVGFNLQSRGVFSIACEQVSTLSIENIEDLKPVQPCMRIPECPFESLLLNENKMMLVSNLEQMRQFLIPEATEE